MENKTWYYGEKIKHLILGGKDENESENDERAKKRYEKAREKVNKEFAREGEESKTIIKSEDISRQSSPSSPTCRFTCWRPGTNSARKSSGW